MQEKVFDKMQYPSIIMMIVTLLLFSHSVVSNTCDAMDRSTPGFTVHHQLQSLLELMYIKSVMPSNHLILCCHLHLLLSIPESGTFQMSQFFASGGQSIGVSASGKILPMNIQDWFPLGLTGLISLQSKGLSRVFSNTTVQNHQFFSTQLSL